MSKSRHVANTVRTDEDLAEFFEYMGKGSYHPKLVMMFIALQEWADMHG